MAQHTLADHLNSLARRMAVFATTVDAPRERVCLQTWAAELMTYAATAVEIDEALRHSTKGRGWKFRIVGDNTDPPDAA